jgi:hypothetical protein
MRQSGGHAAIYSEVGEGTTVKLYFPRLRGSGGQGAEQAKPVETASRRASARRSW